MKQLVYLTILAGLYLGMAPVIEDEPLPEYVRMNEWLQVNTENGTFRGDKGFVKLPRAERDSIYMDAKRNAESRTWVE